MYLDNETIKEDNFIFQAFSNFSRVIIIEQTHCIHII